MTNWFLHTFFRAKWDLYGHWSMTHIIGTFVALVLGAGIIAHLIGAAVGWLVMLLKEVSDWWTRGEFTLADIEYNSYGAGTVALQGVALWLIFLAMDLLGFTIEFYHQ